MTNHFIYFLQISKRVVNTKVGRTFNPGEVYAITPGQARNKFPSGVKLLNSEEFIKPLDIKDDNYTDVLFICGGGIGDILAMSALCHFLYEKGKRIHFATQSKFFDVLRWFSVPINTIDMSKPILKDYTQMAIMMKYKNWRRAKTEMQVVLHNHENWYNVLFSSIGALPVYTVPKLEISSPEMTSNIRPGKSLLICNESSCMMRTIEFAEIFDALPDKVKSEYDIYSYVPTDIEGVKVIKANGVNAFFCDLMAADMVITVDSAAAHFREGVGLSAITLFNSFPYEIRTATYQHVKSYNIKSECDMQPCFKHELSKGDLCPKIKTWQYSAPCFRSSDNKYLGDELRVIFERWEW